MFCCVMIQDCRSTDNIYDQAISPRLISGLEELVQQDKIRFFTEYGSRTLNIGKDDPPGTTLRLVKYLYKVVYK